MGRQCDTWGIVRFRKTPMPRPPAAPVQARRRLLIAAAAFAGTLAEAQQPASAPVRLIVPFTPGTGVDTVARELAPLLAERFKRPFVVENKPGASGNIGAQEVARAAPDGGTLLVGVNTMVMARELYPKAGFDPLADFVPISLASWGQLLLVASAQSRIETLPQLLERARARPGALNYASPGAGTPHHMAMELLKNRAKVSITHIAYRGTAPAVTDLLGGQIELMFLPIHVALQHVRAGTLKALAISSEQPHPLLPQVPPLRTLGVGNLNVDMWYGVLAPKGTPRPLVERLNKELGEILQLPSVASTFQAQGMTPATNSPEAFQQLMAADAKRWAELIRAQRITAE